MSPLETSTNSIAQCYKLMSNTVTLAKWSEKLLALVMSLMTVHIAVNRFGVRD